MRDRIVIPAREARGLVIRRWDPEPLGCTLCNDTGEVKRDLGLDAPWGFQAIRPLGVSVCPACGGRQHSQHPQADLWGQFPTGGPSPRWGVRA